MKTKWTLVAVAFGVLFALSSATAQTLHYYSWEPNIAEQTKTLIAQFESAHPGVHVDYQVDPPAQYWPKMSALAAAHRLPDVFYMSSGFVDEWQSKGLLADLNSYASSLNWSDYYTGVLGTARFPHTGSGDLYAIPIDWVGTVLFYNKDAFDKAGVAYPVQNWTWSDFLDAARKTTVRDSSGKVKQWGFWVYGRYAQIEPWVYQNGGHILNSARTRVDVDSSGMAALKFLSDLVNVDHVAPPPKQMAGIGQQDIFPRGMAAMWVDGSWNISNNRTVAGNSFNWDVTMVPRGPAATSDTAYTWPDMMAMAQTSDNKEMAWQFIKFMTGSARPASTYLAGTVPFFRPTAQEVLKMDQGQPPEHESLLLKLGTLPGLTTFTPSWSEWRGYAAAENGGMNGELDKVFNGEESLSSAVTHFTDYANKVLSRIYPNP